MNILFNSLNSNTMPTKKEEFNTLNLRFLAAYTYLYKLQTYKNHIKLFILFLILIQLVKKKI